ncbi:MAG TPA: efflux RND transporter periplasmic adaptor subunit [Clostridiales bacterium]|nr:efflux RND transporter periplasmic adaptor subunit [Clostridiales bacterium]HQP69508.1 efflux RND transporter periplasmic adaptor subunit [Clostridiales bacterium]
MKKYVMIILTVLLILSCTKTDDKSKKQDNSPDNTIPSVKTETVQQKPLQLYAEITGKLEGITDIVYYSEVAGKVRTIEKNLGERISKGEAIAYLDSENYRITYDQTASELKSAEANLDAVRIKTEASRKLYETDKVSKFELTNSESSLKKAEASVEAARAGLERARINFENSKFISPVDGSIAQINIKEGQFVATGQAVASIIDCSKLLIKTGITENDVVSVKNGNNVIVFQNGNEKSVHGTVTGIGKKPDATGNYPVEIIIENPGKELLPGMIVRGQIESSKLENVIYTDFDNIIEEYGKYYVYTVSANYKAVKKEISIGKKYGNRVVITTGLEPGETLITSGIESLSDGTSVRIFTEENKN